MKKYIIAIAIAILFLATATIPVCANTSQIKNEDNEKTTNTETYWVYVNFYDDNTGELLTNGGSWLIWIEKIGLFLRLIDGHGTYDGTLNVGSEWKGENIEVNLIAWHFGYRTQKTAIEITGPDTINIDFYMKPWFPW